MTATSQDGAASIGAGEKDLLRPGRRVVGLVPGETVEVVAAQPAGTSVTVVYRDATGGLGQAVLDADAVAALRVGEGRQPTFDASGADFRLAAEAQRISMAALFDPMLAVSTSAVEPLPHQIQAVYGELLPRTPLRFLLADDPGAGKTIMAGLLVKELQLRGDLERCLVVAPGGLVEQWQDELADKFGLGFDILSRSLVEGVGAGLVFDRHPLLIARMDQLARSDDLMAALEGSHWDLVVVDEAHRMSARWFGQELKITRRYRLGQHLSRVTRHFLLMTATPHAGKDEDFQVFLALLDPDRFAGRPRPGDPAGANRLDTAGMMRRMIKEDLVTMDGKPLFPERRASSVAFELSPDELELYEAVTRYVREGMNRAERLQREGERRRSTTVGFALTVLQRRLASSPEAIHRSLQRRLGRLQRRAAEVRAGRVVDEPLLAADFDADEYTAAEVEQVEEQLADAATAARTLAELEAEIAELGELVALSGRVRALGVDRKWAELRQLLTRRAELRGHDGEPRKLIVFTEHRDTGHYLTDKIGRLFGRPEQVAFIHGGLSRAERRRIQLEFSVDPELVVLVATDAAGEGVNLQRANLMVNYDLPWNPNRIEQRFGRIHRIGQREVCHLWNLVAVNTREGAVYQRLLTKIEAQQDAYRGKVFDVLGELFTARALADLLTEAIRYGDDPTVRARLDRVIDEDVGGRIQGVLAESLLLRDHFTAEQAAQVRERVAEAQARRLQPHFVEAFFIHALTRFGGALHPRETGRYAVTHVPATIREALATRSHRQVVARRYERVCFDRAHRILPGHPEAALLTPGHPLLDATVAAVLDRYGQALQAGAILIAPDDLDDTLRLLVALRSEIRNGHDHPVARRFEFVDVLSDGTVRPAGLAPYLDYREPSAAEHPTVAEMARADWLADAEEHARTYVTEHGVRNHLREVAAFITAEVGRVRAAVEQRLRREIAYWDAEALRISLRNLNQSGPAPKLSSRRAREIIADLQRRLARRRAELDRDAALRAQPPVVMGRALVVPAGLLAKSATPKTAPVAQWAADTATVERRAVAAVLAAEHRLGRNPNEQPRNNPGFDIVSRRADGASLRIEVKGRIAGSPDVTVTYNEVLVAKNAGDDYRLALVRVSPGGPADDEVRYLVRPFDGLRMDLSVERVVFDWEELWNRGRPPW